MCSRCCGAQDGKDGEDRGSKANHRISALRVVVLDVLSPSYLYGSTFGTDVPNGAVVN